MLSGQALFKLTTELYLILVKVLRFPKISKKLQQILVKSYIGHNIIVKECLCSNSLRGKNIDNSSEVVSVFSACLAT